MAFESKMGDEKFSDFWRGLDTFTQITNSVVSHPKLFNILIINRLN